MGSMGRGRLTPKQERFARHIALDEMTQADAYRAAYDVNGTSAAAIYVDAHRLSRVPNVALRIDELTREAAARIGVTPDWALANLKRAADESMTANEGRVDVRGLTQATRLMADMLGWIPKGAPVDSNDSAPTLNVFAEMSAGQLAAMADAWQARIAGAVDVTPTDTTES